MKKLRIILRSNLFFFAFFLIVGISFCYHLVSVPNFTFCNEVKEFTGKVIDYRLQTQNEIVVLTLQNQKEKFLVRIPFSLKENIREQIKLGSFIKGKGIYKIPMESGIFQTFSYPTYLRGKEIFYYVEAKDFTILSMGSFFYRVKDWVRSYLERRPNSVYLKMLLLGIFEEGDEEIFSSYRKNGIFHLFVISGMHFSFLYHFFLRFFRKFFQSKKKIVFSSFLGISCYYFLLSASVSSYRVYLFYFFVTGNSLLDLQLSKRKIFFLTFLTHLFFHPFSVYQIGFWYSYLLSFYFFYSVSFKQSCKKSFWKQSVFSFLVSFPLVVFRNYEFNPYSIIINFVMIRLMSSLLFPFLLISVFVPPLDFVFLWIFSFIEKASLFLEHLPFSQIIFPYFPLWGIIIYYIFLFVSFSFTKIFCLVLLFFWSLAFYVSPYLDSNAYLYFLDVGEGDATLLISPYRKEVILLDTGRKNEYLAKNILSFLKSLGISNIDYLILSHGDEDHAGNALYFLANFSVSNLVLNSGEDNVLEQGLKQQYAFKITNQIVMKYFSIYELRHSISFNENDNSRVFQICIQSVCTLFLGDISQKIEQEIVKTYQISSQILKVAHHGSKTSTSENLLKNVNFSHAIISAGRNNRYFHPHNEVLERLKKYQVNVWQTKDVGTIRVTIRKKEYTITTFYT